MRSIFFFALLVLVACQSKNKEKNRADFEKYYTQFQVQGSFVLYDNQEDTYCFYNKSQYEQAFTPASTFKICNSLIALETGVASDENFVIAWDSVPRPVPAWNQSQDLKTAFKNSTVWYYQALAKQVGAAQMKSWLDKLQYGNADTTGGISQFWLTGALRISPKQQIDFLKRLYHHQLPVSQRNIDIVKNIMVAKDTLGFRIHAKTGWGFQDNKDIGWYVGYAEKNKKVYFFANCIQSADANNAKFAEARAAISYKILDELIFTQQNEH